LGRRDAAAGAADLVLTCRPGKTDGSLRFLYTLENRGTAEVFVMDALPSIDPATGEGRAKQQAAVVILDGQLDAVVGKFAAPPPTERRVAVLVVPLARRLSPGGKLEGQLTIPTPLAETSPYFADLTPRQYEPVDINAVVFTIGYWQAGVDGLVAAPAEYAPGLFTVITRNTLRSARRVSQRFPTAGLQILKRTDAFARSLTVD